MQTFEESFQQEENKCKANEAMNIDELVDQ
jgi:hypothetical protein